MPAMSCSSVRGPASLWMPTRASASGLSVRRIRAICLSLRPSSALLPNRVRDTPGSPNLFRLRRRSAFVGNDPLHAVGVNRLKSQVADHLEVLHCRDRPGRCTHGSFPALLAARLRPQKYVSIICGGCMSVSPRMKEVSVVLLKSRHEVSRLAQRGGDNFARSVNMASRWTRPKLSA